MLNLIDNGGLPENLRKKYEFILIDDVEKYLSTLNLYLNDFFRELINSPEIMYKILERASSDEMNNSFIFFITNNFYNNIISPEIISQKLFLIIEKLLYTEIQKLNDISQFSQILQNSNVLKLCQGFKYQKGIQFYFNKLLGNLIETYENSGTNLIPLIFNVDKLYEYIKNEEEKINIELYNSKEQKRKEAEKKKIEELNALNEMYQMKLAGEDECDIFMIKYAPELSPKELNEFINKNQNNDLFCKYIKNQLNTIKLNKNENIFSNVKFFENVRNCEKSEKLLFYYRRNFNIILDIFNNLLKRFNETSHMIPERIKYASKIICDLLKQKFNVVNEIDLYKYIGIFFFKTILSQFFLSIDYSSLMSTTIILNETKDNLFAMFEIWKQFLSGNLYTNNTSEFCDYTPFNWYFLESIPNIFNICKILLNVELPEYLDVNKNFSDKNINKTNNDIINNNKEFDDEAKLYSYSVCYTVENINTLINIINRNYDEMFIFNKNNNTKNIKELKNIYDKVRENKVIFKNMKEKEGNKTTNYYIYYELFFPKKISKMLFPKNEGILKIEERLSVSGVFENDKKNKLIRAQNFLINLLSIIDPLTLSSIGNIDLENFQQILEQINKYYKVKTFFIKNNYYYNDSNYLNYDRTKSNISTSTNLNTPIDNSKTFHSLHSYNAQDTYLSPEWYISSLKVCLENLDEEYTNNNYAKLLDNLKNIINNSISKYNFEILSQIIDNMKYPQKVINSFLKSQEKYKNFLINSKIRKFIENEKIEIEMKFKYNTKEKIFTIIKKEDSVNAKFEYLDQFLNEIYKDLSIIKCTTITEFIKKFPNLTLIQKIQEIDVFVIQKEINLRSGLVSYFRIIKEHLKNWFNEKDIEEVYTKIKKNILVKIYDKIYPKEPDTDDLTLHYQCISLSWIEPKHLNQGNIYFDNFLPITTKYFNQINNEKSPSGKLEVIESIFEAINNVLKINLGGAFSTDDIAPICEYALIKAQPKRLSSNLKYLQLFIAQNNSSIKKMHFDYLKTHMNNIKNCNYKHFFGISEKEFNSKCLQAREKVFNNS